MERKGGSNREKANAAVPTAVSYAEMRNEK